MSKTIFDFILAFILAIFFGIFIFIFIVVACIDTNSFGVFMQERVGQYGKPFVIYKLKTIHPKTQNISKIGAFFRKTKLDELPQLFNVLKGEMSFVGPRPDVKGYYDKLQGKNKEILNLKPGITCEASIKYANEEEILALQTDPLQYNDEIIFPDKVKMNLEYYNNRSFLLDLQIIIKTILKNG